MKIICGTDFSEAAAGASELAVRLAEMLTDEVELVHVVEVPPVLAAEMPPDPDTWERPLRESAEEKLAQMVQTLSARGVAVGSRVLAGSATEKILAVAGEPDVRLIVLGTHGRKGVAHFFLGSVAEVVARKAPCPVLVTRGPLASDDLSRTEKQSGSLASPAPDLSRTEKQSGSLASPAPDLSRTEKQSGSLASLAPDWLTGKRRPHLLVPVDGSPGAEAALGWVKSLRGVLPCDLTFAQFYRAPAEAERFGVQEKGIEAEGTVSRRLERKQPEFIPLLERELRRWIGALPGEGDVRLRFHALRGREPEDLAAEAELLQPDLVVAGISQRLRGGPYRDLTAAAVLKAVRMPVVCVPEALRPPADARIPWVSTVLVGTDLTDFSNQVIPSAHALLRGTGGVVEICHVHERGAGTERALDLPAMPPLDEETREEIQARLAQLVPPEAAALGITTRLSVVEAASAADGLMREAERIGADVIVVASHGRGGLKRALLGSIAETIVRRAGRAVLVLHPLAR